MERVFLLLLTIAVFILREGEAIKCWVCNSNGFGGRGCADPFRGSTDISDDLNTFSSDCYKQKFLLNLIPGATDFMPIEKVIIDSRLVIVCYKLTGLTLGTSFVLRGCAVGLPNITETSCMSVEPQNQTGARILTCNACSGDFCNGAADVESPEQEKEPEKQTIPRVVVCNGAADVVSRPEPEKQTRRRVVVCSGAAVGGSAAMLFVVTVLLLLVKTTSV